MRVMMTGHCDLLSTTLESRLQWIHSSRKCSLQVASRGGAIVVLDCGGVEGPIAAELLQLVTIISPNETELARLTGAQCISVVLSGL